MAMASKTNVHGPASYMMNTGFLLPGFPCLGAWLSYGLGSLTTTCRPSSSCPTRAGLPYNATGNFSAGFLPVAHQGTIIDAAAPPRRSPTSSRPSRPSSSRRESERDGLELLAQLNRDHAATDPGDSRLEARIASYELAAKMQLSAPEALDLLGETRRDHASSTASTTRPPPTSAAAA